LKAHRKTLQRLIEGEQPHAAVAAAQAFVDGTTTDKPEELALENEKGAEQVIDADQESAAEAASIAGAAEASTADLRAELEAVDTMMEVAERHGRH
jgi:hypothetical protein